MNKNQTRTLVEMAMLVAITCIMGLTPYGTIGTVLAKAFHQY